MKFLILVLCLSFLWGCSYSPTSVQIEIDTSFSPEKQTIILEALQDWAIKTNSGFGVLSVTYVDSISTETVDNCIKFVNQDVEENHEGPHLTILGLTNSNYSTSGHPTDHVQATVLIWNEESDDIFAAAARHELGHAFLVNHYCTEEESQQNWTECQIISTDPEPAIMRPSFHSDVLEVQPIDAYRFCQQWNCPK